MCTYVIGLSNGDSVLYEVHMGWGRGNSWRSKSNNRAWSSLNLLSTSQHGRLLLRC